MKLRSGMFVATRQLGDGLVIVMLLWPDVFRWMAIASNGASEVDCASGDAPTSAATRTVSRTCPVFSRIIDVPSDDSGQPPVLTAFLTCSRLPRRSAVPRTDQLPHRTDLAQPPRIDQKPVRTDQAQPSRPDQRQRLAPTSGSASHRPPSLYLSHLR